MTTPQLVNEHPAYRAAWDALFEERFADVLKYATELQEAFPDHTTPHMLLGEAWAQMGMPDKATDLYSLAMKLHETRWATGCRQHSHPYMTLLSLGAASDAAFGMGRILEERGRPDEALPFYEKSYDLWPGCAYHGRLLAERYMQRGRREEAAAVYRYLVTRDSAPATDWALLGATCNELHAFPEAQHAFHKCICLDDTTPEHWVGLGRSYRGLAQGRPNQTQSEFPFITELMLSEAIAAFHRALDLKPDCTDAWIGLGEACAEADRTSDAIMALDTVLALDPTREEIKRRIQVLREKS